MKNSPLAENKKVITNFTQNRKLMLFLSFLIFFITLISPAKADMAESIASMILVILLISFVCAGIGWWHRRQEENNK